jgi:hypothetical protein
MAACRERADKRDPLPDWFTLAEKELRTKLARAKTATITIRIQPETPNAKISISSFAPDEVFAPRPIHLPRGAHVLKVIVDDVEVASREVAVIDDTAQEITFDLDAKPEPPPTPKPVVEPPPIITPPTPAPAPAPREVSRQPSRTVPWAFAITGAALLVGGGAYHVFAFAPTRDDLAAAAKNPDPAPYAQLEPEFETRRRTTLVLYGAGAAMLVTGLVLRATVYRSSSVQIGAAPTAGGAVVSVELRR